ncbi:Enolase 1-1, partial [Dictyocoela muelleri]
MKIKDIYEKLKCRQILTSKGYPTVEVDLKTSIGVFRSSCPAGQSTGKNEAKIVIDNEKEYMGKSVHKALFNIKKIIRPRIEKIFDCDIHDQKAIDDFLVELDGTHDLSRLGANAILPISLSFCRAGAESMKYTLWEFISKFSNNTPKMPFPCFNIINGGVHSGNDLKIQEIMVCFKEDSFSENLEKAVILYSHLKSVIRNKYGNSAINVGDEGGFAPPIRTLEEGLDLIIEALEKSKLSNMGIVIDAAATSYFQDNKYHLEKSMTKSEYIDYLKQILIKYPAIFMIEDAFAENDYESWAKFREETNILLMGDDLTVTNAKMVQMAADQKLCNAVLIKPNQNGTVTGTLLAIKEARKHNMPICVSHRS